MNSPDVSTPGKRARTRKPSAAEGSTSSTRRTARAPISPEERQRMIEVCAYFIAEQRGFSPGSDQQDWLEAESRIDMMLATPRRGAATRRPSQRTKQ